MKMNLSLVEKIAAAVLYEGYILYPYRPSSVKNQQRFNFGALYPESYSLAGGGTDACVMQTECLVKETDETALNVKVRFLHLLSREVGQLTTAHADEQEIAETDFQLVGTLAVDDQIFQTWQEVIEREVDFSALSLSQLVARPQRLSFTFPSSRAIETLRDQSGQAVGVLVRTQRFVEGAIEASAERVGDQLYKITVRVLNLTPLAEANVKSRDEALSQSLLSTHTILNVRDGGEFVSLLDPPESCRELVAQCQNMGTWPVLVGDEGARDAMLSSPIILYDYPQIAPESAGDLFDGTEIDEILTLRIMTLTDEEKREMRGADARARQILERTETLPAEQLMKMHGALRSLRPAKGDER